jgi:hypothetical protein
MNGASGFGRALLRPGYAGECRHLLAVGTAAGQSNSAGLLVYWSTAHWQGSRLKPGGTLACSLCGLLSLTACCWLAVSIARVCGKLAVICMLIWILFADRMLLCAGMRRAALAVLCYCMYATYPTCMHARMHRLDHPLQHEIGTSNTCLYELLEY